MIAPRIQFTVTSAIRKVNPPEKPSVVWKHEGTGDSIK